MQVLFNSGISGISLFQQRNKLNEQLIVFDFKWTCLCLVERASKLLT